TTGWSRRSGTGSGCPPSRTPATWPGSGRSPRRGPAVGLDGVHVRGGDQLGDLVPGGPQETALAARLLVGPALLRVAGDLCPGGHRVTQPPPGLAPQSEKFPPHVRIADP